MFATLRRKIGYARHSQFCSEVAEGVGFEPTDPCGSPVFKTGPLSRSGIPPHSASRLLSTVFSDSEPGNFIPSCCQLLPKVRKYANDGTWHAEHCEYFRIRATAITIITSMDSRSTESESAFFSQPKGKPEKNCGNGISASEKKVKTRWQFRRNCGSWPQNAQRDSNRSKSRFGMLLSFTSNTWSGCEA